MVPRSEQQPQPRSRQQEPRAISVNSTKRSYRSHSSSFEADDERSSSADESMGPDLDVRNGPSQYADGDAASHNNRDLLGWYTYGFAAEVFVICGMGSFIPIALESLARQNGVLLLDKTTPCGASSNRPPRVGPGSPKADQCVVFFLGMQINTASFAMYTFSLSVLFQALLVVSISGAADRGNHRKRLLLFNAFAGALAMMLFLPVVPEVYLLGALLAIIANTCFGASFVLLNSFLPLLVRRRLRVLYPSSESTPELHATTRNEELSAQPILDSSTALLSPDMDLPSPLQPSQKTSVALQLSTRISSTGIGIGYGAGLFLQCACIVIIWFMGSTTFSLRVVLFLIGCWWATFTIPAAIWLPSQPDDTDKTNAKRTWVNYIIFAWQSLWRTIKLARRLKDITLFLLAWFLLSDAIATVSGTAVLYAKTQLHMRNEALGLINVIVTTSGLLGAFSWSFISRVCGLRPHQTILACICIFELIPLYGLLGYLDIVKQWGVLGLQKDWEMYPLGFVYGVVLGGLSSYCRSLFGELIPPGSEAAFYALYAITDKGSSVFGPAIVGAIVDRTGEIRPAFWFLALLVGLPGPIIYFVDVNRGKEEGAKLVEVIRGLNAESAVVEQRPSEEEPLLG